MNLSQTSDTYLDPRIGFCVDDVRELIRDQCRFELPSNRLERRRHANMFKCETYHAFLRPPGGLFCTFGWSNRELCVYGSLSSDMLFKLSSRTCASRFRWDNHHWLLGHTTWWHIVSPPEPPVYVDLPTALRETGIDIFLDESDFNRLGVRVLDRYAEPSLLQIFAVLFERHLVHNYYVGAWNGAESCDVSPYPLTPPL